MTRRKKRLLIIAALVLAALAAVAAISKKEDTVLQDTYVLEQISAIPDKKGWKSEIEEGDVILEKNWFTRVPARFDRVKPLEKEKVTNAPQKQPERLLRIKELREDGAVIAVLHQNIYYEGDLRVTEEYETLRTVEFGQIFSVNMKMGLYDAACQPMHEFVVYRKADPIEPWRKTQLPTVNVIGGGDTLPQSDLSCCCSLCGQTIYYHDALNAPRYCTECGGKLNA